MKKKGHIQTGDTVIYGKKRKVGNVVCFRTPAVAYVRFANEQVSFIQTTKLKKANGKLPTIKIASRRRIKK